MRFELNSFLPINTPHMNHSVLTSRYDIFCVGSKRAFNNWRFIQKACQLVFLLPLKSIQQYDHVISGCNQQEISAATEFHNFYLTILFEFPIAKRSSFTFLCTEKTYANIRFLRWHLTPCNCKHNPGGIITGNWIGPNILFFHIQNKLALFRVRVQVPNSKSVILACCYERIRWWRHYQISNSYLNMTYVSLWPSNTFITRLSWMDQ